jgi:hypothetical protein
VRLKGQQWMAVTALVKSLGGGWKEATFGEAVQAKGRRPAP